MLNHYETVFILNPVLSDTQIKETVQKFEDYLVSRGAEMISKENWGLKKLAYPIQKKKSGFYHLLEFTRQMGRQLLHLNWNSEEMIAYHALFNCKVRQARFSMG